jgi:hypothetical protein
MKIKIENENGIYSIKSKEKCNHINEYFNQLIIPALLAVGFTPNVIKDAMEHDYGLN